LFGFNTTWGAFTYPFIFIITDLTTRLLGEDKARRVVYYSMFPGLIVSYIITVALSDNNFLSLNILALRIATACFMAYIIGQLLDIYVFQRLRNKKEWWKAPLCSTFLGNIIDTFVFFFIAFYQCEVPELRDNWLEIAYVDLFFKVIISTILFVPIYGAILNRMLKRETR
jgi:hypothetical protein